MTEAQSAIPERDISAAGWVLVTFRVVLMLILLVVCTPLHFLWKLVGAGRFWPRTFLAGVGAIAGLHIKQEGKRRRHSLILANHVSWLDIPALAHATGTAFVAQDGLAAFPFLKWLCEMNETVFIARHDRNRIADQVAQVKAAMDQSGSLTIFPEGTTSDGDDLLPFKSALLSAVDPFPEGAVMQPVLLKYEDGPSFAWVGTEPGLDNFLKVLARTKPIRLTIHFLEPITGDALENRKSMTHTARSAMLAKLAA
ncbi:lysophospholipid acyltransferase family protein [Altererythrobacter sp. ZODW24]|uniref:lysophospholipid acyltransferase family protein n=1 Tax=Altererythrobacter sp. ZODW24 TaxID=2185142 RepID=UPI000DF740AA|nr:lysophospholipid acyltransferase family protein [Altererythrobacter sp. ZODW24]